MKTISVIIATYNSGKYLKQTLNSIVSQEGIDTLFKIELIVADDGSNDNTIEIAKQFTTHCIALGSNSGGPNKGRNTGLRHSTGEYICIADHDDVWEKDKIISQLKYLESVPIVTSGYTILDNKNNRKNSIVNSSSEGAVYYKENETFLKLLSKEKGGQNAYLGSIIFSCSLKSILFEENFGKSDYDWVLILFHKNDSNEVCKSLYTRVVHGNNLSLNNEYRKSDFYFTLMVLENYETAYPKETKIAVKKTYGSRARYYYLTENMSKARYFFSNSNLNAVTLLYYITSFWGYKYILKHFRVFG